MLKIVTSQPDHLDEVGMRLRKAGYDVRDCLSIQASVGATMTLIGRENASEGFVETFLRTGEGVLNIEASRISMNRYDLEEYIPNRVGYKDGVEHKTLQTEAAGNSFMRGSCDGYEHTIFNTGGRFPTNFMIQHSPDCSLTGTKKVRGNSAKYKEKGGFSRTSNFQMGARPAGEELGYADEDGMEKIADWQCELHCPVSLLDAQSHAMGMHSAGSKTRYSWDNDCDTMTYGMGGERDIHRYGDDGGASRFFCQSPDVKGYLDVLIRKEGDS